MKKLNVNIIFTIFIVFTMLYTIVLLICPYAVSKTIGIQDYNAFNIIKEKGEVFSDTFNALIIVFVVLGLFLILSTLAISDIITNKRVIVLITSTLLFVGIIAYMVMILDIAQNGVFSTGLGPILSITAYVFMFVASLLTGFLYKEQDKIVKETKEN